MRAVSIHTCASLSVLLIASLAAPPVSGSTWRVAKDGTGDFEVIQDAVDVASSGDTIEIGPGRYDEYQTRYTFDLHVLIPDGMELTFIGAGSDQTFIGPEASGGHQYLTSGFWGDNQIRLTIRDLSVENCDQYSIGFPTGSLDVEDCRFYFDDVYSLDTIAIDGGFSEGATIRNCRFEGLYRGVATVESPGGVLIENCEFVDCIGGTYAWTTQSSNIRIVDSDFIDTNRGVGFLTGSGGEVLRCRLNDARIVLENSGEVSVTECVVTRDDGNVALYLHNILPVTLINNVFSSNGHVIECRSPGQGTFRDNHILRTGSGYAIKCLERATPYPDIDFSGNWWGTTDLEEIAAGIWDRNDDDGVAHYVIFEPIADGPVPVEVRTLSEVKELFR